MIDYGQQGKKVPGKLTCKGCPTAPGVPPLPTRGKCPVRCDCPDAPPDDGSDCNLDQLIEQQKRLVTEAERAREYADELVAIKNKVKSAQADYTHARFIALRKRWKEQDDAIWELIRKLVCAVDCWECVLDCHICRQLVHIRTLEECLDGPPGTDVLATGPLTTQVYSLRDRLAWHERNVKQLEARMARYAAVLGAWEDPSARLGEALDRNESLTAASQDLSAGNLAKVVYDVFMTLIPRHLAIRPRDEGASQEWKSSIEAKYLRICECPPVPKAAGAGEDRTPGQNAGQQTCTDKDEEKCQCDEGMPDICCGINVGILSLRQRLVGPLPYIVDPAIFPDMLCCLIQNRLSPASAQLAGARAEQAATVVEIDRTTEQIKNGIEGLEAAFKTELAESIDCRKYQKKQPPTPAPAPAPPTPPVKNDEGGATEFD